MKVINRMMCVIAVSLLFPGCASMAVSSVNTQSLKGKDVDTVISELKGRGLTCGQKYEQKVVGTQEVVGIVGCGATEWAVICPEHYGISIVFDLATSKVDSVTKLKPRTNCF